MRDYWINAICSPTVEPVGGPGLCSGPGSGRMRPGFRTWVSVLGSGAVISASVLHLFRLFSWIPVGLRTVTALFNLFT